MGTSPNDYEKMVARKTSLLSLEVKEATMKILLFLYTLKYIENLAPCSHMRHTINAYGSVFAVLYGCGSGSRTPVLPVYETGVIYISISLNRNGDPTGDSNPDLQLEGLLS